MKNVFPFDAYIVITSMNEQVGNEQFLFSTASLFFNYN